MFERQAKACPYRYMAGRSRVREEGKGQEGGLRRGGLSKPGGGEKN